MLCPQEQAMTPLAGPRDALGVTLFGHVLTSGLSLALSITSPQPQIWLTL